MAGQHAELVFKLKLGGLAVLCSVTAWLHDSSGSPSFWISVSSSVKWNVSQESLIRLAEANLA